MERKIYFYSNKEKDLYYESENKEDVLDFILDKACIYHDYTPTVLSTDLQNEILTILEEKYIEEYVTEEEDTTDAYEDAFRNSFDESIERYKNLSLGV